MTAAALLKDNPQPTDEDIDGAMAGNLCRLRHLPAHPRRDQAGRRHRGRKGGRPMSTATHLRLPAPPRLPQAHRSRRRRPRPRLLPPRRRLRPRGRHQRRGRVRPQRLHPHRPFRRGDHRVQAARDGPGREDLAAHDHRRAARSAVARDHHRAGRLQREAVRQPERGRQPLDAEQLRQFPPPRRHRAHDARPGRSPDLGQARRRVPGRKGCRRPLLRPVVSPTASSPPKPPPCRCRRATR
jgi:hypothetical protein